MANVFGQGGTKKQNKAWHLTKLILSFYYQKIKNKNRTEGGEKKGRRKWRRRRRKGLRPPVSCDVDSGYLVSISTGIFSLSFFLPADFLFPAETHLYSADMIRFGSNQPSSARISARRSWIGASWHESGNQKKKTQMRHWHAGSRVGSCTRRRAALDSGVAPSQLCQCFLAYR